MQRLRIIAFLVPAVIVAALAVALSGGTPTQAREASAPSPRPADSQAGAKPTRVVECFRVDVANNQPGADPKATVRLVTDNFGGKLVRVRKLVAMCELAYKFPPPAGASDDVFSPKDDEVRVFACYQIQRGQDPNDPFVLDTQNFQKDLVQVRASHQMCEEATKTRTDAAGTQTTVGSIKEPTIWQCFNLEKSKPINRQFRLVTNNFGRDDALVIKGTQLCEEARKDRLVNGEITHWGEASGRVAECFRLESKIDPKAKVTLTTQNFGPVDVVVRRATQMCEPGTKTPVYTLPDDPTLDQPGES